MHIRNIDIFFSLIYFISLYVIAFNNISITYVYIKK